jgi:hypothetical protein
VNSAVPSPPIDANSAPASVTVWPLITYLIVFDFVIGFSAGIIVLVICGLLGAPGGVTATAALLAGAAVWLASWLRTSIRFTPSDLVTTKLLRSHRIPWADVIRVSLQDMHEHDTDEVTQRRLDIGYRRETRVGHVALPLFFPPLDCSPGTGGSRRGWARRRADRQREIIRAELAAHGHPLPD